MHPGGEQHQGALESHKSNSTIIFLQPLLKLTSLGPGQATLSKADSPWPHLGTSDQTVPIVSFYPNILSQICSWTFTHVFTRHSQSYMGESEELWAGTTRAHTHVHTCTHMCTQLNILFSNPFFSLYTTFWAFSHVQGYHLVADTEDSQKTHGFLVCKVMRNTS